MTGGVLGDQPVYMCFVDRCLPQAKEFKYLGVLFLSEGKMEGDGKADRCGCSSKTGTAPDRLVKRS